MPFYEFENKVKGKFLFVCKQFQIRLHIEIINTNNTIAYNVTTIQSLKALSHINKSYNRLFVQCNILMHKLHDGKKDIPVGPLASLVLHIGPLILSLAHLIFHCSPGICEILPALFRRS